MSRVSKFSPLVFPLLLILSYFIYSPGLDADFIFDDSVNLNKFVDIRVGFDGLWQFFRHTERPLSFLSFMMNDNVWPSTADAFLKTNLLLHILCFCLLASCIILIGKNLEWNKSKRELIAIYSAFIWLMHPLFVSTTLYVIQRMTILSAIFVLLSLICYLYGRYHLINNSNKGWKWLIIATPFCGIMGLLCKENAALIPFYLLVFECTLFYKKQPNHKYYRLWKSVYIYLPILIIFASVFIFLDTWFINYYLREFNLIERLMTQANILIYYLFLIIIPKSSTNGLHYENYPISTSVIEPLTTLPAIILIIGLLCFSIFYRKKYPVISFAFLFYFAGHLMESTIIALELYFEHRNYFPSMMLFFAFTYYLSIFYRKYKKGVMIIAFGTMISLSSLTYARASLWGNPLLLLMVWTENNPMSHRNYIEAHIRAHNHKRYDLAQEILSKGINNLPNNIHLWIGYVGYNCATGNVTRRDIEKLKALMSETTMTTKDHLYHNLVRLLELTFSPRCELVTKNDVEDILLSALENPNIRKFNVRLSEITHLLGRLELEAGNYEKAYNLFLESFSFHSNTSLALQNTALLGTYEKYEIAYKYLQETKELIFGSYTEEQRLQFDSWKEFTYMESILLTELENTK